VTCSLTGESSAFQLANKVRIFPGKINVWLIGSTHGSSASLDTFIKKNILKPLNTRGVVESIFSTNQSNVVYSVTALPSGLSTEEIRTRFFSFGLTPQETTASKTVPPIVPFPGQPISFYIVSFIPPLDAPSLLPWPVSGCVEEAQWWLAGASTDRNIATSEKAPFIIKEDPENSLSFFTLKNLAIVGGLGIGLVYLTPAIARAFLSVHETKKALKS
jgi:hypothetical protein